MPGIIKAAIKVKEDVGKWSLEMERTLIGMDHTEAGARFLKKWHIPKAIIELIANHHSPENSDNYPAQTGVVRISSILVQHHYPFSIPFDRLPVFFPHHLENPESPQVVVEMKDRYNDYIRQADTIADLMTEWL